MAKYLNLNFFFSMDIFNSSKNILTLSIVFHDIYLFFFVYPDQTVWLELKYFNPRFIRYLSSLVILDLMVIFKDRYIESIIILG